MENYPNGGHTYPKEIPATKVGKYVQSLHLSFDIPQSDRSKHIAQLTMAISQTKRLRSLDLWMPQSSDDILDQVLLLVPRLTSLALKRQSGGEVDDNVESRSVEVSRILQSAP